MGFHSPLIRPYFLGGWHWGGFGLVTPLGVFEVFEGRNLGWLGGGWLGPKKIPMIPYMNWAVLSDEQMSRG